ncbi:MAG: four helix bundle protein [Planctomycetota bacterium]|nr:four helix bundle protein [Planctomycetota bacterium]
MTNEDGRKFDLTERTAVFGEELIAFLKQLPVNDITSPLIRQVVRSGTSIGANYSEADEAGTKKQFRNFISICKRESKETKYWLRMIAAAVPDKKPDARALWKEADELNRIFAAIHRNSKDEDNDN